VLGYSIDRFISENLKISNSHSQREYSTWNAIVDGKLDADIFVYGSSRACTHFDPKIIEDSLGQSVFNLGIEGHTFGMQYLRHLLALENNSKPKVIIHSVDIGTLQKGRMYNPDQFLPYMLWNKTFYDYMSMYDGYSYFDYKIPLIRYYGKLEAIKTAIKMSSHQSNEVQRIKGYLGNDNSWNNDFDNAKKSMKKYVSLPDSLTLSLFDNYLAECKKNKIDVILVYSPYYIEGQEFIKNQSEIINIYEMLAQKYDFMFLDFTKDEICFDKKYFYNTSHMNKTGAELFTKKLCNQIKEHERTRACLWQ
jgi:hypothetical protein